MKERPILFSGPMVRAILEGRKTQTRRIIPFPSTGAFVLMETKDGGWWPYKSMDGESTDDGTGNETPMNCRYGVPGDRLWVKETAIIAPKHFNDGTDCNARDEEGLPRIVQYLATSPNRDGADNYSLKISPSIFMPRWASRITLEITDVRVQRLQEITESDAEAEGLTWPADLAFPGLWDSINAKRGFGWDTNPWVWALTFKRLPL